MPRPKGGADVLENRRERALKLLDSGFSLNEVGKLMGCSASSVMRWRDARQRHGVKGLKVKFSPGRPLKLDQRKRKRLVRILLRGPMVQGYRSNLWTTARIAEVIRNEFGVEYHKAHVGRLMHQLKWSAQKPERRATERNEAAIEEWKRKQWPRIKKTLLGWTPI